MARIKNKLTAYKKRNAGLVKRLKIKGTNDTSWLTKALIVGVLPSLGNLTDLQAQCINSTPLNNSMVPDENDTGLFLDLDGGGPDFEIVERAVNEGTLYIEGIGGAQVIGTYFATFPNTIVANNYAMSATIDTAAGGAATRNNGFIFYSNGAGDWGSGTTSGYIAVRKGGEFGFIELTLTATNEGGANSWNFMVTVTNGGFQSSSINVPVLAGLCNTLPVEFIDFKAVAQQKSILLDWQTATEYNNAGFNIERSTDGRRFEKIAFVPGAENSETVQEYEFEDLTARKGTLYYYRLKQIDFSGHFEYSEIVTAKLNGGIAGGDFYPNPSTGEVSIDLETAQTGDWEISVFDVAGKQLYFERRSIPEGLSTQVLDLHQLEAGAYFVKLESANERLYKKVVLE